MNRMLYWGFGRGLGDAGERSAQSERETDEKEDPVSSSPRIGSAMKRERAE